MPGRGCCFGGSTKKPAASGGDAVHRGASSPRSEEKDWKVGGRYAVNKPGCVLWASKDLAGTKVGELGLQDVVLMLSISELPGSPPRGLVLPPNGREPGWIGLEVGTRKTWPLVPQRLNGSWEMKARYQVKNPATLREGPSLNSKEVAEVVPGDEVLVLELGHNSVEDGAGKVRLRALVSTSTGAIGWMSPETATGDHLLEPVNLLSHKVVELHQRSLSKFANPRGEPSGGLRRSCTASVLPWEVGCQYRVLERLIIREKPNLTSAELGKITSGSLVTFSEIQKVQCDVLGPCPVAFVTVDDGPERGRKGWVRCSAADGHDLIDTRDQLEYEKVLHRMRTSVSVLQDAAGVGAAHLQAQMVAQQASQQPLQQTPEPLSLAMGQDQRGFESTLDVVEEASGEVSVRQTGPEEKTPRSREDDDTEQVEDMILETSKEAAVHPKQRSLVDKIEDFDTIGGQDDRIIVDSVVEDKSYFCGCSCGGNRVPVSFGKSR